MLEELLVQRIPLLFDLFDGGEAREREHGKDQVPAGGEKVRRLVEDLEYPACAVRTGRARHPGRVPARDPIEGLGHARDIVDNQVEALSAPRVEQTTAAALQGDAVPLAVAPGEGHRGGAHVGRTD